MMREGWNMRRRFSLFGVWLFAGNVGRCCADWLRLLVAVASGGMRVRFATSPTLSIRTAPAPSRIAAPRASFYNLVSKHS